MANHYTRLWKADFQSARALVACFCFICNLLEPDERNAIREMIMTEREYIDAVETMTEDDIAFELQAIVSLNSENDNLLVNQHDDS